MVFGHRLPQEHRIANALFEITVHREMPNAAVPSIIPILVAGSGKDRMLYGKYNIPAGYQPMAQLFRHCSEILHIMKRQ
ncbi:hypothetical protein D3C81_2243900 [compost metagenome]